MQLLYGTSNNAKLQRMREMLSGLDIEIIGIEGELKSINVDESGNDPLENARIKAMVYYKATGLPTFSCDSGLYIEGLENQKQPGVHVRRVDGKYLNDEEFINYYSDLVLKIGHEPKAKFKNAICLVFDENHIYGYDGDDIADHFIMTSKVYPVRKIGFPMDSISLDIESGKYIIAAGKNSSNEMRITKGFRNFFICKLPKDMMY